MPIYKAEGKKNTLQKYRVQVNYTDLSGNRRKIEKTAYGLQAAKEIENELLAQSVLKANTDILRNKTVNDLCDEYLKAQEANVRPTTLSKTRQYLRVHVRPELGNIVIEKLSKAKLQAWKQEYANKDLSLITKKNAYAALHAVLNYGVAMDWLVKNPLQSIGNFKDVNFTNAADKLHFYTPEQFDSYIEQAKRNMEESWPKRCCYVFFCIAYLTGMRKGEINALKWTDLDGDILHVRRSISQKILTTDGQMLETAPKNRSSYRDIRVPEPLIDVLKEHKERQKAIQEFSESWRIVGGATVLADTTIENRNKECAQLAQLPHIRIHDFRHSHASLLINEGINIHEIARRLGHSDIAMTLNTYGHLYPREEDRAMSVLNRLKV